MSIRAMKWAYGLFDTISLPPAERSVLLALCWEHTEAGGCYPSQARLSKLTGYRRQRVNAIVSNLSAMGLIQKEVSQNGKFQAAKYALFGIMKVTNYGRTPCPHGGTRTVSKKKDTVKHSPKMFHRVRTGGQNRGLYLIEGSASPAQDPIQEEKIGGENV